MLALGCCQYIYPLLINKAKIMNQDITVYEDVGKEYFRLQENNCYQTTRCDSDVKNEEVIRSKSRSQNRLCVLALAFLIILLISVTIVCFAVAFVKITNLKSEITHLPSVPDLEISILNDLIERTLNTSSDMLQELSQNYSELENKTMAAYNALEKRISTLNEFIKQTLNISVHGVIYTRWGKSTCRSGVNRVYAGRTGSNYHAHSGGGANYICMPNDPEYSSYIHGVKGYSFVYRTEYEGPPLAPGMIQHDAPCAVCDVSDKSRVLMIPAKLTCPSGWTREYYGYLMSEHHNNYRTMYTCVDVIMESVPGSQNHTDGGHFYHVEAHCVGVACPPYNNYKELTCVVCSK